MYFSDCKRRSTKTAHPDITLQFAVFTDTLYRAEVTRLMLQMEPSTGGWGAEGVYRLGLWGCIGEKALQCVFYST